MSNGKSSLFGFATINMFGLKNLAGLWGSSYQGILERAVAYYIDEATTSEDFKWKV